MTERKRGPLDDDPSVEKVELGAHPPIREPAPLPPDDALDPSQWSPRDTSDALAGLEYDVHLGLKLYHASPLGRINDACRSGDKAFVDHEFCVGEGYHHLVGGRRYTPGIISLQNIGDFVTSGEPKRVARIKHFMDRARIRDGPGDGGGPGEEDCPRWTWRRASSMPGRELFASDRSVDCRNVIQGKVGNCGFCSGFASLAAQFPESIRRAFDLDDELTALTALTAAESGQGRHGAYAIRIYPEGKRRYLLMDDYLLCIAGGLASPSLHSLDENDLWIRLLEKAFVKLQSSYASLDGYYKFNSLWRHPARAMQLVTGSAVAVEVHLPVHEGVDAVHAVLARTEGRFARVAHGRRRVHGLHSGHGYSLLWVGEISGVKLACLRNPHGTGSYVGEYGRGEGSFDSDKARRVRDELLVGTQGNKGYISNLLSLNESGDNGVFLIEFGVFVECFPIVTLIGPIGEAEPDFAVTNYLHRFRGSVDALEKILDTCTT